MSFTGLNKTGIPEATIPLNASLVSTVSNSSPMVLTRIHVTLLTLLLIIVYVAALIGSVLLWRYAVKQISQIVHLHMIIQNEYVLPMKKYVERCIYQYFQYRDNGVHEDDQALKEVVAENRV